MPCPLASLRSLRGLARRFAPCWRARPPPSLPPYGRGLGRFGLRARAGPPENKPLSSLARSPAPVRPSLARMGRPGGGLARWRRCSSWLASQSGGGAVLLIGTPLLATAVAAPSFNDSSEAGRFLLSHGFCVVSSLPLLDHRDGVFVCLDLPVAELVQRRFPLRPERAHTDCRGDSHGAPTPRAHGRGGPRCPSCSSAARYARTARRRGRLWHIGVSLRLAFLSAGAQQLQWRLSLSLRGCGGCYPAAGVGCSASCSLVTPAVRPLRYRSAGVTSSQVAP